MNEKALSLFIEQVLFDAEQKFGPEADPAWLESYAREAVLNLWLERPEITFFTAYKAFLQLREAIALKSLDAAYMTHAIESSELERSSLEFETKLSYSKLQRRLRQSLPMRNAKRSAKRWSFRRTGARKVTQNDFAVE
jgi:hypothetical protein